MFGRENAKINSKNIWGGDRESGRDLEIEKKRIPFSHENMEERIFLSFEFSKIRDLFPLVEHLLSDMVTHLESDFDELSRRGVEVEGGDIDVAKHGECQILFKDVMQPSDGPASESISSEWLSVFINEEVGSRLRRERQSELSM